MLSYNDKDDNNIKILLIEKIELSSEKVGSKAQQQQE